MYMCVLTAALFATGSATAQTAREEIKANRLLAGSNYLDYDHRGETPVLTPTPKGYEPFYMSHYGRHGSRWLIGEKSYTRILEKMRKAKQQDKLTATGLHVLQQLEEFYLTTTDRLGDLTTVGERQHHGIGQRMAHNFPEIFCSTGVHIDARSTTVNRCILSMIAECEELAAANPTAVFHNDVSESLQYYLNQPRKGLVKAMANKAREHRNNLMKSRQAPLVMHDNIIATLFNDTQWADDSLDAARTASALFEVASNMQSHDTDIDLMQLFTDEEVYGQWQARNIGWYLDYGNALIGEGALPFSQKNLLKNIIATADTVTQTQATLRFGHEVCVMPLACLLELDSCNYATDDMTTLDSHWRNYRIFPMACNIQLVFYRPVKGKKGDILVKALLNEREARLPAVTENFPYYRWADLRRYYLDKIETFEKREKEFEEK